MYIDFFSLSALVFGFFPDSYNVNEDAGSLFLTVTLMSGNPGDFLIILTVATDSSAVATATGKRY